jgi:histidine triad (HIT) family protein
MARGPVGEPRREPSRAPARGGTSGPRAAGAWGGMTIFQKIIDRQVPAKIVYEDDHVLAFHDVHPVAPVHVLVIPKKPLVSLRDATPDDEALLGKLLLAAKRVADELGIAETGFRTVINNGGHAGQSVFHVHVHVLGGRPMAWPPG